MIGHGTGSGAITFLNALFTGIGAAAGIALTARSTVELEPSSTRRVELAEPDSDTPLVRATVMSALDAWGGEAPYAARVTVRSDIPVAKGLKSSSGVGVAVARAAGAALGHPPSPLEVARLASEVAQRIGLSATGAFDDCLAAAQPGVHVTNNLLRERLRTDPVNSHWWVVLGVPRSPHRPSPDYAERFRRAASDAAAARVAAQRGDCLGAMRSNTMLVERIMGYEYAELRRALEGTGALACGVSGMGPALAVISPEPMAESLRALLEASGQPVLSVPFTSAEDAVGRSVA